MMKEQNKRLTAEVWCLLHFCTVRSGPEMLKHFAHLNVILTFAAQNSP